MKTLTVLTLLIFSSFYSKADFQIELNNNFYLSGQTIEGTIINQQTKDLIMAGFLVYNQKQVGKRVLIRLNDLFNQFHFQIPDSLKTGVYSIQFFDNSMNTSIINTPVIIINSINHAIDQFNYVNAKQKSLNLNNNQEVFNVSKHTDSLKIQLDTNTNEKFYISIKDLGQDLNDDQIILDISNKGDNNPNSTIETNRNINKLQYQLKLENNGKEAEYKRVLCTSYDAKFIRYAISDNKGILDLNFDDFRGETILYLKPFNDDINEIKVSEFKNKKFSLTQNVSLAIDRASFLKLIQQRLTSQLVDKYYLDTLTNSKYQVKHKAHLIPADKTIHLEEYYTFNKFKSIIKEIVPNAFYKNDILYIFDKESSKSFQGAPLILINGLVVNNQSYLSSLDVSKITDIQIIHSLNLRINIGQPAKYGALVIHTSQSIDELLQNLTKIKLHGLQTTNEPPSYSTEAPFIPASLAFKEIRNRQTVIIKKADYQTTYQINVITKGSNYLHKEIYSSEND